MKEEKLDKIFKPNAEFFLSEVCYSEKKEDKPGNELLLECKETISAELDGRSLRVIFTRTVQFQPEALFDLSVSFGAILLFDESYTIPDDVDWSKEFSEKGDFIIPALACRTSLIIAQLTSAAGFAPLILPPTQNKDI